MNKGKKDVIVLSRNYSTGLGVIRSLGSAGYNVDLVSSTKKKGSSSLITCSRFVRTSVEVQSEIIQGDPGDDLVEALLELRKHNEDKAVLFPTDDFTAAVVLSHKEILKEYFLMPDVLENSRWTFEEIMDKSVQEKLAKESGLLTPEQWTVSLEENIYIPDDMIYPCFVKPLQSISGRKSEMAKCNSREELENHLSEMKKFYSHRSVLVQEYLDIEQEYDLSGVCSDQNVVIPGVIKKTKIASFERGVTMSGKMEPVEAISEIRDSVDRFLKSIHYTGMFDMELNFSKGRFYFNEINLRSGGPSYFYYLCGINLPALAVQAVSGKWTETEISLETGKTFVYEKVCWEDYIHGYINRKEKNRIISGADYRLIKNEDDPLPGKAFHSRIRLSFLKNRLKKILGKS